MANYIDGFVLPVPKIYLDEYRQVAEKVAQIWKAYGAIAYFEYLGNDMVLEGTKSFMEVVAAKEDEEIVFGWVVFPSKAVRDLANSKVPLDPRMTDLVAPLVNPEKLIFDASRMVYGGFKPLVRSNG
ncbi:DUF1428 domain-containing protein [Flagellimonas flava]|uniref:Uncharacterized conserved protein YbaA, DUF1428 family n=1 Tax=Flagellimonas flava TaxID=570519 RepID=A0A1M5IL36_9FLAO|nr:DUF1428 domain-containing protein [Allomuricauda flava]SHG28493.1 Uncharacterized conserved protein YbaA, DUF1428 family [Allomuricauda flava]